MHDNEKARHFTTTYLDGFAGSGRRYGRAGDAAHGVFTDFQGDETTAFYRGSAYRALDAGRPFDKYIFIERSADFAAELQMLVEQFPARKGSVRIIRDDANAVIPKWCSELGSMERALVFLDPYGMQVDWTTVQAIAATEKIDLLVLVPLGQAINRVLTTKGQPPEQWAGALTRFFGDDGWRNHFYTSREVTTLFGAEESEIKDTDFDGITKYFVEKLGTIFSKVLDEPLVLRNTVGVPIYLLCFAASNPKGAPTAIKIAKSIVGKSLKDVK
jgi:three-Cys-motif partner protein